MKLGICNNWGSDLDTFRVEIQTAAEQGFELIGVGDTPAGWHDLGVSLTRGFMTGHIANLPISTPKGDA